MECPICGSKLNLNSEYYEECGLVESNYECKKCKLYTEEYAYGQTEINIGSFITGYTHNISDNDRIILCKEINTVARALRKLYDIKINTSSTLQI